jgi:hypothetical protein
VLQVWSGQQDLCRRQTSDFFKIVLTGSMYPGAYSLRNADLRPDLAQFTPYLRLISPRVLFLFADSGGSLRLSRTVSLRLLRPKFAANRMRRGEGYSPERFFRSSANCAAVSLSSGGKLKAFWRWKSRQRAGRPKIDRGLRDLIGRISK